MIAWHLHRYEHGGSDRWVGEYWPDGDDDTGTPWGVVWVADYPEPVGAVLLYALVADQHRRRGVASALIADARRRWPGLRVTEGVTPAGEALYASLPDAPYPPEEEDRP